MNPRPRNFIPPPRPVAAVVFDGDGVLFDTAEAWKVAEREAGEWLDYTVTEQDLAKLSGASVAQAAAFLSEQSGASVHAPEIAARLQQRLLAEVGGETMAIAGAVDLVDAVRFAGKKTAIASNAPREIVEAALDAVGLRPEVFDAIVAVDDPEVDEAKPSPVLYQVACRRLGVEPYEAVAVEDSERGVDAARRAGLFVIGLETNEDVDLVRAHRTTRFLDSDVVWDALELRFGGLTPEQLGKLYDVNAAVAEAFWDWRNKLMRFSFAATGAVFAIAGWLWIHKHSGGMASLPLWAGAIVSVGCVYLERRNHEILGRSYRVGAAIEASWGTGLGGKRDPEFAPLVNSRRIPKRLGTVLYPLASPAPAGDYVGGGVFTTFAQGKRMYFSVLRIMFLLAALVEIGGAIYFIVS